MTAELHCVVLALWGKQQLGQNRMHGVQPHALVWPAAGIAVGGQVKLTFVPLSIHAGPQPGFTLRPVVQMEDKVEDLLAAGVLDPAKVTRSGLTNACGIAGIMLTTQASALASRCSSAPASGWRAHHPTCLRPLTRL